MPTPAPSSTPSTAPSPPDAGRVAPALDTGRLDTGRRRRALGLGALALAATGLGAGLERVRAQEASAPPTVGTSSARLLALRLRPGQDLRRELLALVEREQLEAVAVVTCVGSLTKVTLRYADREEGTPLEGRFELVSLVGTLSRHGSHLHLSVSDGDGRTLGGHLLDGSAVYTTAEVVLAVLPDLSFRREPCAASGYRELVVRARDAAVDPSDAR